MDELKGIRKKIDVLDKKIIKAYAKRMGLCKRLALIKKQESKEVCDKNRESEVVQNVKNNIPYELCAYAETLYKTVIDTSKEYQKRILSIDGGDKEGGK